MSQPGDPSATPRPAGVLRLAEDRPRDYQRGPVDWDAGTYHRVSEPQLEWAREVLDRLPLRGDETVLDAGCGTGRVARELLARLPRGRVIAVDAAPAMVRRARSELPARVDVRQIDLLELSLPERVDAVLSTATFHWIADHERLFRRLAAVLVGAGRLVAQCGGRGNIDRVRRTADEVGARAPFGTHLGGWAGPWNYAGPEETERRLLGAGFAAARCWLAPRPVRPPDPPAFVRAVCLRAHLDRLPDELREPFVAAVLRQLGQPLELDYVRLNIDARMPGETPDRRAAA